MDLECPYCEKEQDINHDDGFGYDEDRLHEMQCNECEKYFTFTTYIMFHHEGYKADCLNGAKHKWKQTSTFPKECTKMSCEDCEEQRQPSEAEWEIILKK